jgi:Tfp pilus assembly protein PilF
MLLDRVPGRKKLLDLDTINLGFIRPDEAEDRQMAYCQAQLYARYMAKRFGADAQIKMLAAYRRGLTTERAINECFHVDKADFEKAYLSYLDEVVGTIRARVSEAKEVKFSELERRLKAKPDDPDLNAELAYEHYARRDLKAARPLADKALKLKPNHPLASYVKARLLMSIGDDDAALALIEPALDPNRPNERVVDLTAELTLKAGRLDDAARLYELARKDDPGNTKWIAGLARVHLRQKNTEAFLGDMALIAANDADDLSVRKVLAQRWLKAGDAAQAEKWAEECLHVDVYDSSVHVLLADALSAGEKYERAVDEYRVALDLKPKKPNDLKVKLAEAQLGLKQDEAARATLDEVLKADPEHPEAKALRAKASPAAEEPK